jgi:hypothetical protein
MRVYNQVLRYLRRVEKKKKKKKKKKRTEKIEHVAKRRTVHYSHQSAVYGSLSYA